jgi:hypothetical protein
VFTLGLPCGYNWVAVKAKTGFAVREGGASVDTPCPFIPGGAP